MAFNPEVKRKTLLWCDRHCCLCKKACGANIELHHLIPKKEGGGDDIDNAMPLCFECHAEVGRYNKDHRRGTKYKVEELKARREQVYEDFTRHLVPPITHQITQKLPEGRSRTFPDVGFKIWHRGDSLPVQVRVEIKSILEDRIEVIPEPYYSGDRLWNLNPQSGISGHFEMRDELIPKEKPLELCVTICIIDQYGREHQLLPVGHSWVSGSKYWYLEPSCSRHV